METKKWAIAISEFGGKYSAVITSWEIDPETGGRINQQNRNKITETIEEALQYVSKTINE